MVIIVGNGHILDKPVCISLYANTLEKGMTPSLLFSTPQTMNKLYNKLGSLAFGWQPV